jgi:hypothetical protein
MSWALQRLRTLWLSRWTMLVAVALAVVGVASWLWSRDAGLWQAALDFFFARDAVALLLIVGTVTAILLVWLVPKWQIRRVSSSPERQLELENEARKTVAQIVGGAAFLIGLYFTAQTLRIGQESLRVNQEGQITERFTKAIEQLGSKEHQIRLGGIYALERIARDSERDHAPIIEVLTAYVREKAPIQRQTKSSGDPVKAAVEPKKLATDVQAILTVLGRRTPTFAKWETLRLDLEGTDLHGAELDGANLQGAIFVGANLQGANLRGANLQGANLSGATLQGAFLSEANLQEVDLAGANLQEAFLRGANLQGANLSGATLRGANLQAARNLTQPQIDLAITDETTKCPADLKCKK